MNINLERFRFRNFVMDIHTKTGQLINRGTGSVQQVAGGGGGGGPDLTKPVQEMKESLNLVRRDLASVSQRLNQQPPSQGGTVQCPEVPAGSCVSTTVFVVLMAVQLVIMISYLMYR